MEEELLWRAVKDGAKGTVAHTALREVAAGFTLDDLHEAFNTGREVRSFLRDVTQNGHRIRCYTLSLLNASDTMYRSKDSSLRTQKNTPSRNASTQLTLRKSKVSRETDGYVTLF